jgi:hypothetical protein
MSNSQLYLSIGVPTFAVLASFLVNLFQISGVRGEMGSVRGEMGSLRGEMSSMRGEMGSLRGEMGSVRGDIASLRAGQDMLTGKIIELVDRISRLETKNER